jgi:hypothetical protein
MSEPLLERPPPPPLSDFNNRLQRQVHRISISQSVAVTYALVLSMVCLIALIVDAIVITTLPLQVRIVMGTLVSVLIVALQIVLCVYARDPVFSLHFVAMLMFFTGVGLSLSALHLFYTGADKTTQ